MSSMSTDKETKGVAGAAEAESLDAKAVAAKKGQTKKEGQKAEKEDAKPAAKKAEKEDAKPAKKSGAKKPAAKKSSFGRPSVVASFCLHRAGCPAVRIRTGSFPLGSNGVGALLATESYDLRVLANRTILHVAAGHPSLRFGRAVFFRDSGLRAPASVSLLRIARFQSGHIP